MMRSGGTALALLGALSCSAPEPRPIDPAKTESEFRARTLEDPGLGRFFAQNARPGEPPFPPPVWDLRTLTLAAFYFHPDLDVARARLAQVEAGRLTAGMWPNPVLGLEGAHVSNLEPGLKPWIYGFNLSFPVDTLWKRGYRIEEADRMKEAASLGLAEAAWHVRSRVRQTLSDHLFARRSLEYRQREEAARRELVVALERKLALGDIFRLDVDAAQGELSSARLAIHTAEGRVAESRVLLAGALGVPTPALRGRTLAWPELESPPSMDSLGQEGSLEAGLLSRLDLRGLLAEYEAAEAVLKREVASRYPDVSLAPGYLYDQGQKKLTLGLSVTLPVLNQNEGPIAEADAHRQEIAARFRQLQAAAIGDLEAALARYRAAWAEIGEADKTLAALERREKATRRAIELKDLDRTALLGLGLERVQAEEAKAGALKRVEDALGALEDALERPLGGRSGSPKPEMAPPRGEN
jgi:outer membrane protein TolC